MLIDAAGGKKGDLWVAPCYFENSVVLELLLGLLFVDEVRLLAGVLAFCCVEQYVSLRVGEC